MLADMSSTVQQKRTRESELIVQIQGGDKDAYMELVGEYRVRLYRKACSIIRNPEEAEDVLQDALVSAYRALDRFRGESGIYTWLYRIVVNKCRDYLRSRKSKVHESFDDFQPIISDNRISVEKKLELSEESTYLLNKINEMDEKYRESLILRYYEDLSYEEIAQISSVNLGTVKSRLFKARELLKRAIIRDGKGEEFFNF